MSTPGPWTSHGHDIEGVTVAGGERPPRARCGGPGLCGPCSLEATQARNLQRIDAETERPSFAKTYGYTDAGAPTIDGKPFPWGIHEDGPRVECIEPGAPFHILWMPVLVDAPIPEYAHEPPGESLNDEHPPLMNAYGQILREVRDNG